MSKKIIREKIKTHSLIILLPTKLVTNEREINKRKKALNHSLS